ncbi:MaoC/PaaZ C-terminal domain-containing protein [Georgenia daeguensis]|uniref:MaoC/PaaZ C-terminal domain-containing protein n=1 Tax=Georgenia daeguensis TaxID=908355 RepID=A0ABP8EPR8_9MICO
MTAGPRKGTPIVRRAGADLAHTEPAGGPPSGYREEVVHAMPSLRRLYAKALGRLRTMVMARPVARGLPQVVLRVDGVRGDPAGLSEYQHLVGEPGTDALPAGYVHVLAFPLAMAVMVREDFPLPVLGLVHVGNRVDCQRQLTLDDAVTVRAWAQDAREHARGTTVDLVVEVTDASGRLAWRGVSTYLAKGRPPRGLAVAPARERGDRPDPPTVPTAVWRLAGDVGVRYAEVSGDRNPIHVSRVGARLFGFRRPIAHGMYTAARALAAAPPALRQAPFTWSVEFAKPVLLPATVAFAASPVGTGTGAGAVTGTGTGTGTGTTFAVWSPRSGAVHLTGTVVAR